MEKKDPIYNMSKSSEKQCVIAKWGTIAVDPSVIPYGTKVYIPRFGKTFVAEDCGGAIKGNKIDIFMNSESECNSWGRRSITIQILD